MPKPNLNWNDKEAVSAYHRQYYLKHQEKIKAQCRANARQYYQDHKEEIKAKRRKKKE